MEGKSDGGQVPAAGVSTHGDNSSQGSDLLNRCHSLEGTLAGTSPRRDTSAPPKPVLYLYLDVEANGPVPGEYSMISLAAVAFQSLLGTEYREVTHFHANLFPLNKRLHPEQKAFWDKHPEAYAATQVNQRFPGEVMADFAQFVRGLQAKYHVFPISWPAAFDWQFVNYYFHRFCKYNPLGYNCLDHGSFMWAFFGTERATDRWDLRPYEEQAEGHKHVAIHDARKGARLFHNVFQAHNNTKFIY